MKYLCRFWVLLLLLGMAATAKPLELARNGVSAYSIVIATDAPATDRRAALELSTFLERITRARFPVVTEDKLSGGPFLSVGRTALMERNVSAAARAKDLGESGYALMPDGDNLYLWGGSRRGALNAVYAFLEEDLGCRWYTPRYEWIPEHPVLSLELAPRYSLPAFPAIRDPLTITSLDVDWSLRNRSEPLWVEIPEELGGRATHYSPPWLSHSYDLIVPASELATHPECFAMAVDGTRTAAQRCPSNPQFQARSIEFARRELQNNPQANHVIIAMADNYEVCHCPDCQAKGTNRAHLELVNQVAKAIAPEFPDARVATLAYFFVGMPPENFTLEPNVTIWLCTDCVPDHLRQIPAEKNPDFAKRMAAWAAIAPELHIWDYHVTYINNFIYDVTLYAMQQNLRYYQANGVDGVQLQGPLGSGGEREGLRSWAFTKLMWNPNLEMTDLIDDYCGGVFGAAAEPIRGFYRALFERGVAGNGVLGNGNLVLDPTLRPEGLAAFDAAYELAGADRQLRERLDLEFVPVLLMQIDHLTAQIEDPADGDRAAALAEREARLTHLRQIIEREKLERYQMEGMTADLLKSKNLWDEARFPVDRSAGAVLLPASRVWIWRWTGPGLTSDEQSGTGNALHLPYTPNEYPVRWLFQDYPTLKRGGKMALKLRVKAEKATGEVLEIGSYTPQRGFQRAMLVDGANLGAEYRWIDAGTLELEENPADGYLFIRAVNPGSSTRLLVDAVQVEPIRASGEGE